MSTEIGAVQFIESLESYRSPEELKKIQRYFKTGEGQYGEGDVFMGVRMGQVFELAKTFIDMPPNEIEKLLESPIHEVRAGALSIMGKQTSRKKTPESRKKELFDLYIRRHDRVNNWDLVDLGALYVVGNYLFDKPRDVLYKLAHSENLWERRTAIVSTAYFIKQGDVDDTFKIAEILLHDAQDLIHKATGWMLRTAGSNDRQKLLHFLDQYAPTMPRTLLRYAIEHLDKEQRTHYLNMKKPQQPVNKTEAVDAYMEKLDHPLKAEAQTIRDIIKNVHPDITEQIKWNAPSFSYKGYMVTFNLRAKQHVHLVFHNGAILSHESGLLEGDYPDRRMAYFSDMETVEAKKEALENAVREWIEKRDQE
ncbi:MAG: DNA alkylation repair protein [Anaerolineae bacterium]|nr:DNA alkylation repair protein [Anaerolineae bacterium]